MVTPLPHRRFLRGDVEDGYRMDRVEYWQEVKSIIGIN